MSVAVPAASGTGDRRSPVLERVVCAAAFLLVFFMVYAPTWLTLVKMGLLAVCLLAAAAVIAQHRDCWRVDRRLLLAMTATVLLGAGYVVYGLAMGNPGAAPGARVHVAWLLVFTVLVLGVRTERGVRTVLRAVVTAVLVSAVYGLAYCLAAAGLLPEAITRLPLYPNPIYMQVPGQPLPAASFLFLGSYLFGLPICAVLAVFPSPRSRRWIPAPLVWSALLLAMLVIILSGRRAAILAVLLTPAVALVVNRLVSGRWLGGHRLWPVVARGAAVAVAVAVLVGAYSASRPLQHAATHIVGGERTFLIERGDMDDAAAWAAAAQMWSDFAAGFDVGSSGDAATRVEQAHVLLDRFADRPVFGWGLGATTPGYVRSDSQPWAFELTYVSWLMQFGLVGTLAYAVAFAGIVVAAARAGRRRPELAAVLVALTTGMIIFLIGNATNPYLGKFDGLLPVFLPLLVAHVAAHRAPSSPPGSPADRGLLVRPAVEGRLT